MSAKMSWVDIVLKAIKELGTGEKAVSIDELYSAVKRVTPARCSDSNLYTYIDKGRQRNGPKWKRNVRDALVKLKRRGVVERGRRQVEDH